MPGYLPQHLPDANIGVVATAAITGGQVVTALGAPAGADATNAIGVAGQDVAIGQRTVVFHDGVQRPIAAAPIAAGALVKAAAAGQVTTYTVGTDAPEALLGVALEAAAAGDSVPVKFRH